MITKINNKYICILSIVLFIVITYFFYNITRPTIIFHTYIEEGYLGKIVTLEGNIDKLYTNNYIAQYKLPHLWKWKSKDEIAIFTSNYNDLISTKDIDFWRLEIYLNKTGHYKNHKKTSFFSLQEIIETQVYLEIVMK